LFLISPCITDTHSTVASEPDYPFSQNSDHNATTAGVHKSRALGRPNRVQWRPDIFSTITAVFPLHTKPRISAHAPSRRRQITPRFKGRCICRLGTDQEFPPGQKAKGKSRVHPRTAHEGPEGEQRYSYTLSFTWGLYGGGWLTPRAGRFTPRKDPVPIVQEAGWTPVTVWTGAENLAPHRDSIPGPYSP